MNKKMILYGLIILLTLTLTLGAVSANDLANETISLSVDNAYSVNEVIETSNDVFKASDNDILGITAENNLSAGEGTFSELESKINSASGTLTLDKDYSYNTGFSTDGIKISKTITIDGNGYTINAKDAGRAFYITGSNVVLKNLNIINGKSPKWGGGAIYVAGQNCIIDNCNISNSVAPNINDNGRYGGGAIYWNGPSGTIKNSQLSFNHADARGGAIHWIGDKGTIDNVLFINNSADTLAGAVYVSDENPSRTNTQIIRSTFIGNRAYMGGAVLLAGIKSKVSYSKFYQNHAYYAGGAVIEEAADGSSVIDNCIIVNNTANNYGGGANINFGTISNSIVENNTAYAGGGIYATDGTINNVVSSNNFAVLGLNLAILGQTSIIYSYIEESYHFNVTTINNPLPNTGSMNLIGLPNGDYAYCIEKFSSPPSYGYHVPSVELIRNTKTGENVGEYIKILVYENINDKNSQVSKKLYDQIWIFVEEDFRNSNDALVQSAVRLYDTGFRVPTVNATKRLPDGTTLRYDFYTILSANGRQNLFYFTITTIGKTDENPNLDVQKLTLNKTVNVGEQTTFTIVVKNTGNVDLNQVTVTEKSYDGLTFASASTGGLWTQITVDGKNAWRFIPTLKQGMTARFNVTFNTNRPGNFTNIVVAKSDKTENKTTNNTTEVIDDLKPDMIVTKKSLTPNVLVGEQTKFLITVTNTGDIALNNVFVTEEFPDGLTYADYSDKSLWSKDANTFNYNGVLVPGESASFTIVFNTHINGTFMNCVVAGSDETGNMTSNNTTTVKKPCMEVNKKSLTPNVLVGEQTKFLITVINTGEVALNNVFVTEEFPDGLTYADYSDKSLWSKDGNTFYYNGVLVPGESASFIIVFNTHINGTFVNCVVAGSDETENKTSNNTTTVKKPDMEVTKISLNDSVLVGEQTFFVIIVTNTGEVELNNVFVTEEFPDGLEYAGYTDESIWSKEGNTFYYNGVLVPGESVNFTIVFNTHINGTFVNCVVAGSDKTENKTSNNTTTVKKPGMEVNKVSLTPNVLVGEQTLFLITVTNTGEVTLSNVFVEEQVPDGLTFADYDDKSKWSKNGDIYTYLKDLVPGESASFTIAFNTHYNGTFVNCVVAGSDKTDNKTSNNTTHVYNPDLVVEKITIDPLVTVGEQVMFEIVVSNIGQKTLTNVFVEESQYSGLVFDHAIINSHWSESIVNGKHRWTLNSDLLVGERIALNVVFNTTTTGTFTNVVVAGSDETENKTTENKTKVVEPKLDVQKITLTPYVHVGDKTSFEIVVRNTGDVKLTNVFVEETSYAGLVYDSYVKNSEWTYSLVAGKHRWTLNKILNPGEVAQFIVVFNTIEVGNFTNIVTAGSGETPNKPAQNTTLVYNNTDDIPVSNKTRNADLTIEKIALDKLLNVGEKAQFEIVVQNTGNVALSKVTVYEESFTGLTYDSWNDYTGLWTKNSDLSWTYNDILYPGEYATFFVTFNTLTPGDFTNVVSVDSNETSKKRANDNVVVIAPSLNVEKITLNQTVNLGEQVMFEIVVHNTGSTDLTNVIVREDQFEGLKYYSYIDYTDAWIYNGDLTWTLTHSLKSGEYAGFFVIFDTTRVGDFVNIVTAKSNEVPEKSAHNDTKVIDSDNPDSYPSMTVEKYTINKTVYFGEQTMFEIVVRNTGNVDLKKVFVVEAFFDEGLSYNSFYPIKGIWTHTLNNQNLDQFNLRGTLKVGDYASFVVIFDTSSVGVKTNIVTAGYDGEIYVNSFNETEVINKDTPVNPDTPDNSTTPENKTPETPEKTLQNNKDVLPATGNPLILVLLALICLGAAGLRRRK